MFGFNISVDSVTHGTKIGNTGEEGNWGEDDEFSFRHNELGALVRYSYRSSEEESGLEMELKIVIVQTVYDTVQEERMRKRALGYILNLYVYQRLRSNISKEGGKPGEFHKGGSHQSQENRMFPRESTQLWQNVGFKVFFGFSNREVKSL